MKKQSSNFLFAIAHLSSVTSVEEWNDARENLKANLTIDELNEIDGSGLIVRSLGEDKNKRGTYSGQI